MAVRLTVLCDNHTYIDQYYLGEPALSCYLEDGDRRILFDTGYSGVFLENARRMGLDLSGTTDIVLSHGHNDHTGGLRAFWETFPGVRARLTCHPALFAERKSDAGLDIGPDLTPEQAARRAELNLSAGPCRISPHAVFLGAIPRRNRAEAARPVGRRLGPRGWEPDFLPEDSALALSVPDGMFLLLGCSHSGVCNILARAKELFPGAPLRGLLGGMHLLSLDESVPLVCETLGRERPEAVYPCHCTCFDVRAELSRTLPVREVGVGLQLEW